MIAFADSLTRKLGETVATMAALAISVLCGICGAVFPPLGDIEMWRFEIRDDRNRLLDMRRRYFTEDEAQEAGTLALRAIEQISPGRQLRLLTAADE